MKRARLSGVPELIHVAADAAPEAVDALAPRRLRDEALCAGSEEVAADPQGQVDGSQYQVVVTDGQRTHARDRRCRAARVRHGRSAGDAAGFSVVRVQRDAVVGPRGDEEVEVAASVRDVEGAPSSNGANSDGSVVVSPGRARGDLMGRERSGVESSTISGFD
ncbi:MAG: hypothetical protein R3F49_10875 [Planctomycetota bacterium]